MRQGGLYQVGSARSGATQTVQKALCNYRAPSRPVQCRSAGAGPVILGMACNATNIKPNPATHTAWSMLPGSSPSHWHHCVCTTMGSRRSLACWMYYIWKLLFLPQNHCWQSFVTAKDNISRCLAIGLLHRRCLMDNFKFPKQRECGAQARLPFSDTEKQTLPAAKDFTLLSFKLAPSAQVAGGLTVAGVE